MEVFSTGHQMERNASNLEISLSSTRRSPTNVWASYKEQGSTGTFQQEYKEMQCFSLRI
jgi:hypothetical protein